MLKKRLLQTILEGPDTELHHPISTIILSETDIQKSQNAALECFHHAQPLGISPGFNERGYLVALAIADSKECRIIQFEVKRPGRGQERISPSPDIIEGREMLNKVLCREHGDLLAFDLGPLAMSLHKYVGIRISNAVDIQSSFSAIDRKPISAIEAVLGDSVKINQDNVRSLFRYPVYNGDSHSRNDLFMRAWVSQFLASFGNGIMLFEKAKRIDTRKLTDQHLAMIAKVATDSTRLDHMKPLQTVHKVAQIKAGNAVNPESVGVRSDSYETRIRGQGKTLQITSNTDSGQIVSGGVVGEVRGRIGYINSTNNVQLDRTEVTTVTSIGRDDPTTAEAKRAGVILRILQGDLGLLEDRDSPWVRNIWFTTDVDANLSWPKDWSQPITAPPKLDSAFSLSRSLNPSQQKAINAMLSQQDKHRITIIQGPPGTGKTTVISSFVQFSVCGYNRMDGIWLVAQSNVAVKNIAEKLLKDEFENWKLLVSKEFMHDWHDHLYEKIKTHLISSDEFKKFNTSRLRGICVMLSTLSMLSNRFISTFTRVIPLHTVIVDEASQIEIGDYIPIFSAFKHSLRKMCFIGDDKQLPPFGQEDLQDLQSIFEVTHLRKHSLFLDMQYRMPPQIGDIISEAVYEKQLKSDLKHPVTSNTTACYFINIPNGKEKQSNTKSFMNELECQAILKLARKLQDNGKSYRIITPYEAQRNHIELSMKAAELDWGNTCFNVDSFQGNEEDYIIISVVRNREIGFLKNFRRTNVMLSRCKRGMFIFSSEKFLTGAGADTLVGILLAKMGGSWLTEANMEEMDLI